MDNSASNSGVKLSKLNPRQAKFIKGLSKGLTKEESAIMAGYSKENAHVQASRLLHNASIIKALDEAGLTDNAIANSMKIAMTTGLGVKSTNADAIHVLELATRLKGYQNQDKPEALTQNNIYINELKNLDDTELETRLKELTTAVQNLT